LATANVARVRGRKLLEDPALPCPGHFKDPRGPQRNAFVAAVALAHFFAHAIMMIFYLTVFVFIYFSYVALVDGRLRTMRQCPSPPFGPPEL